MCSLFSDHAWRSSGEASLAGAGRRDRVREESVSSGLSWSCGVCRVFEVWGQDDISVLFVVVNIEQPTWKRRSAVPAPPTSPSVPSRFGLTPSIASVVRPLFSCASGGVAIAAKSVSTLASYSQP